MFNIALPFLSFAGDGREVHFLAVIPYPNKSNCIKLSKLFLKSIL